jgi:hypothetical protein
MITCLRILSIFLKMVSLKMFINCVDRGTGCACPWQFRRMLTLFEELCQIGFLLLELLCTISNLLYNFKGIQNLLSCTAYCWLAMKSNIIQWIILIKGSKV